MLRNQAKLTAIDSRVRGCELRVVQSIEGLCAKFQPRTLPQWCQLEFLEQRQSSRPGSRCSHVRQNFGRCAECVLSRNRQCIRIGKVLVQIETRCSLQRGEQVGPLRSEG